MLCKRVEQKNKKLFCHTLVIGMYFWTITQRSERKHSEGGGNAFRDISRLWGNCEKQFLSGVDNKFFVYPLLSGWSGISTNCRRARRRLRPVRRLTDIRFRRPRTVSLDKVTRKYIIKSVCFSWYREFFRGGLRSKHCVTKRKTGSGPKRSIFCREI